MGLEPRLQEVMILWSTVHHISPPIMWLEADSEREVLEHGQFSIVFCKSITHTFASGTCCAKINLKPCPGFQILQTYHTYLKLGETLSEPFPIDCWQWGGEDTLFKTPWKMRGQFSVISLVVHALWILCNLFTGQRIKVDHNSPHGILTSNSPSPISKHPAASIFGEPSVCALLWCSLTHIFCKHFAGAEFHFTKTLFYSTFAEVLKLLVIICIFPLRA